MVVIAAAIKMYLFSSVPFTVSVPLSFKPARKKAIMNVFCRAPMLICARLKKAPVVVCLEFVESVC